MIWSKPLTVNTIIEGLQRVIYDMHALAGRNNQVFEGVVMTEVPYTDPEGHTSFWRVTVEPETGEPVSGELFEEDSEEDVEDEDIRATS